MRKSDRPNPGEEFFYKLSLGPEFEKDLRRERIGIGIPKNGFKTKEEQQYWLRKNSKKIITISTVWQRLRARYKIPKSYLFPYLNSYLFFGKIPNWKPPVAQIGSPVDNLENDIENYIDEPYAKVIIFGNATKSDAIKFITEEWDNIEKILKKQGWSRPPKIRRTIHKERNILIKQLWRKPKRGLQKELNSITTQKELLIQRILKKRGFVDVNEGYIRKMSSNK